MRCAYRATNEGEDTMRTARAICVLAAVSFLGMGVRDLLAEEPSRVLNGHAFIPSEIIPGPFAISAFSTRTGGGLAFDLKTPFYDPTSGDELGTLEGDVGFMALGFGYQQRFGNWFAARFNFGGTARMGVDEQALLAQGINGAYVFKLGGIARILQSQKFILSGSLDISNSQIVGVDPYGFAQKIIDEGLEVENNDLVKSANPYNTTAALLAGWAPRDWLGINGYLDVGRGGAEKDDRTTSVGGGLQAGVDFKALDVIPIGFHVLGRSEAFSETGADLVNRSWIYGFGLSYTGWDDFVISLETTMALLEARDGDDFEAFVATFNLRYWPN
jgi:hypothetical protein